MRVLFVGDIVGQPGRDLVARALPALIESEKADFVIANAENAAGGRGLTGTVAHELYDAGVNVLTLGNHAFDRREIENIIDDPRILRPANYPPMVPGHGYGIFTTKAGSKLAVVSLMGRIYLPATDCPFRTANAVLEKIYPSTRNIVIDFHAEVTSEKIAMGHYLDGRVSAVIGTHTHIQTADEHILTGSTAYITDAGMTGPVDGVIGMDRDTVIKKFLTGLPQQFSVAQGRAELQGCVLELDGASGRAVSIRRMVVA